MVPSRDEIETGIESLAREVVALRSRVDALEALQPHRSEEPSADLLEGTSAQVADSGEWAAAEVVSLAGRSLVVFGGAFLLRAVAASDLLPAVVGPLLGLIYAGWWLVLADRSAAAGRRPSAFFHGLSGLGVANPLIWETTVRFHLLPNFVAATTVGLFLALGIAVGRRNAMRGLCATAVLAALAATLALLLGTRDLLLFSFTLLAVATGIEWLGPGDDWPEVRWAPALALDLVLILLALFVSQPNPSVSLLASLPPGGVVAVALLSAALYVAAAGAATLLRGRPISLFELLQVGASLACGIGTALVTMVFHGASPTPIAIVIIVLGSLCYALALRGVDRGRDTTWNFHAYTTYGGLLVLAGTSPLFVASSSTLLWTALASLAVALGVRFDRDTLKLHGAIYLAAAAFSCGLPRICLRALVGPATAGAPPLEALPLVVTIAALVLYAVLAAARATDSARRAAPLPAILVASLFILGGAGLSTQATAPLLIRALPSQNVDALIACTRTVVLSSAAIAVALGARRWSLAELAWVLYPMLAATGGRMVWEDLRFGQPLHLFVALGFYGAALIAASRLLRRDR